MRKDKLGNYLTLSILGKGSFSEVVLVKNKLNGKLYALKIIKKQTNN